MLSIERLDSGVAVLVLPRAGWPGCTVSVWVRCGSRHERPEHNGATHVLEHFLWRGSPEPGGAGLDHRLEALGAEVNAATTKEALWLHARAPAAVAGEVLRQLAAQVVDPPLPEAEFAAERAVVVEELHGWFDVPAMHGHDRLYAELYPDDAVALPTGGTPGSVGALTYEVVRDFCRERFHAGTVAVVVAGDVEPRTVRAACARAGLDRLAAGSWQPGPLAVARHPPLPDRAAGSPYLFFGSRAPAHDGDGRWAAEVLAQLLGGGPAAELHRLLRTEHGLAYDTGAWYVPMSDGGTLRCWAGTAAGNVDRVAELCVRMLDDRARHGWTAAEVDAARRRAVGHDVLAWEGSLDAVEQVGRNVLVGGLDSWSHADYARAVAAVTVDEVNDATRSAGRDCRWVVAGNEPG